MPRHDPLPAPPGGATGTALKCFVVLHRTVRAVQDRLADWVERQGLTLAEFGILEALYHKGPLLLGNVQRKILVSSGGITFLMDRLAAKGLVERKACASDRRARYAALTPAGERLMREIFPAHAARIAEALAGLSPAEQRTLIALLKRLGHHAADLPPFPAASAPAGRRRPA